MVTPIQVLTRIATDWVCRCFGDSHFKNVHIRSLRNVEEIVELAQAIGVPRDKILLCVNKVYDKPEGNIENEIGGSLLTLVVLCEAMGKDPEEMLEKEVRRVLAKSPEFFAKRNQDKIDGGLDFQVGHSGGADCNLTHICGATPEPCNGLLRIRWRDGERVKADRLWVDEDKRRQFESETGLSRDMTHRDSYELEFNRWALRQIRRSAAQS